MADVDLDVVRREFAALTGLFEGAALIASAGQGIQSVVGGRRQFRCMAMTMDRIQRRLTILERRLR